MLKGKKGSIPGEAKTIAPAAKDAEAPLGSIPETKSGKGGAFANVKRELTDKDLENPVVGRMLLNENDRCREDIVKLEEYKEKFYIADKDAGILRERIDGMQKANTGRSILLILGSLLAGFLPSLYDHLGYFIMAIVIVILFYGLAIFTPYLTSLIKKDK